MVTPFLITTYLILNLSPSILSIETEAVLEECPICLQTITDRTVLEGCQHAFDFECIREWLQTQVDDIENQTCPICREVLLPNDTVRILPIEADFDEEEVDELDTYRVSIESIVTVDSETVIPTSHHQHLYIVTTTQPSNSLDPFKMVCFIVIATMIVVVPLFIISNHTRPRWLLVILSIVIMFGHSALCVMYGHYIAYN